MRGFSALGLYRPKTPENVGGALRASDIYGCSMFAIEGERNPRIRHGTNVSRAERRIPVLMTDFLIDVRPFDCPIVVVELRPNAVPLPTFKHPERAFYILGPEDGSVGARHIDHAQHVVYVPGRQCMNLAACANVVLYDRMVKRGEWQGSSGVERGTENSGVGGSIPPLAANHR